MPFDAGVMSAVVSEVGAFAVGARIEKVNQPERDEIVLALRSKNGSKKLLLSAAAGCSRVGFTDRSKENPAVPPMFCMLLRKHLTGGYITDVRQLGFDRAMEIVLVSSDELGYQSEKSVVIEIMGTYSNILLLDKDRRIAAVLHPVSLNANNKRQVLAGFPYENPDPQIGKTTVTDVTREDFLASLSEACASGILQAGNKYLLSHYAGLSPLICREITFRTSGDASTPISSLDPETFWLNLTRIYGDVIKGVFSPCIVFDSAGKPVEFAFCDLSQYGAGFTVKHYDNISMLLDAYFDERDRAESVKRRGQDILRLLTNAAARIDRKTALQKEQLAESENMDGWKLAGDLITANMYALKKGMTEAVLVNYFDEAMPEITVKLDDRYTPAQNAQQYYKKYNKAKSARAMLAVQLEQSAAESAYIDTVFESLTKARTEDDLAEIRAELAMAGYGKKLDNLRRAKPSGRERRLKPFKPLHFITTGGFDVYVGKNNLQNDYVTTKLAEKNDWWFHVKNAPGSHVLLVSDGPDFDPPPETFTECAMLAAFFSSEREKPQTAVDYTRARYVKKPAGAKPGFVIYEKNYTAYVTPDPSLAEKLAADEGKTAK